ncbi:hypothetical protein CHS0354_030237 [Potamilus streckersoni]|uniref:MAM domain-containing protein n=1 Tax=Potamilus streckersoni TaxID=2493646 RepID=A0AAE0RSJ4_9BIVA|nr:hypothetical protein CHS0354_030237 [Potamilus streckersoni]
MIKRWMYVTLFPAFIYVYTNPIDCDFENDSCSWSIDGFRRISYNQFNGTGGWNDHLPRNGKEWFLYFDATNASYATLKSKQTTIQGLKCLNFWYRVNGTDESQIQVIVHDIGGGTDSTIWEKSYNDTVWNLATVEIDVHYSTPVTFLIRGKTGRSYSKIGIDDVVLKLESCLDCNFLDGLCSWKGEEWTTTKLNYTATHCKDMHPSILSSFLEIYPGKKCLSFKYQTNNFHLENLVIDVQSYHGNKWQTVWNGGWQQNFQGWKEISADINLGTKSMISIRFGYKYCSNATYYLSSISLKKQSCTESTTTFITSPTTVCPTTANIKPVTENITTTSTITTFVTVTSTDIATTTSTEARAVTTTIFSSPNRKVNYSANGGVIIGIVIGCLGLTVAMLLVAIYLCSRKRRATSPGTIISKNRASKTINENGKTRHSTERLNETSDTVPFNEQAQVQLLDKDENNMTNRVQIHGQYHQSADKEGTNSNDTMHNTYNHTMKFRNDIYDSTIIYPKTILNATYDHTNFTRNFDNIYDQTNLTQVRSLDTTLQTSIQDFDPTYDHA